MLPVSWSTLAPTGWTWLLAMLGVLVLMAPPAWPSRWLGMLLCLPVLSLSPARPAHGKLWLTQLDVGQGLATVIQTRQHTLIYDTGPRFSKRFDTGQAVVIPFLQKQGIKYVDTLMISHRDNDHIGGAKSVLKLIKVNAILSGEPGRPAGAIACIAGQSWTWDGVYFQVLHPQPATSYANRNNGACVLKITEKNGSVLLTGDIEAETEYSLLQLKSDFLRADVLIVPHHGSKTSSQTEFIDKVSPQLAIISAGYRNRYRHPSQAIMQRYQQAGIRMFNTAKSGAIRVSFADNKLEQQAEIVEYRVSSKRFWFDQPAASSKARRLLH
jgi:competence protein ComEC